jgi:hypothetical protein
MLCDWGDSNPHAVKHEHLKLACLPFHHNRVVVTGAKLHMMNSKNKRMPAVILSLRRGFRKNDCREVLVLPQRASSAEQRVSLYKWSL